MEHQIQFLPKESVEIDYEALPDDASLAAHLSAGALAGIMEHTVMFPIDSIKTRMQMNLSSKEISRGLLKSISKISSTEGFYALWKGVSSVIVGAGPAHAIYFSVFEATKTYLVNRLTNSPHSNKIVTDENHPLIASCAGITGTTASDALMTPFDMLKQRMQASAAYSENKSTSVRLLKLASEIYKKEGLGAFYISYPTTLLTNIPFAALNFGFYEYCSSILNPGHIYNPYLHCVSGGIAGGIAAALTTPFDCIKTVLQTKGISQNSSFRHVTGFKSAAKALLQQGGATAFWKGLKPRVIFNIPSTAISWTAYEMCKELLIRGKGI
ncbi:MRS4 Mitochondrial RNA-splicing protein MRS4 [Candida maltosa Xu316]|uniref:Mitochondrial thiamine pyrophosphate carrier 1 n=1 Tax=Candida maltosa (strain Xu316) TaxID=1245528 RepID=M3K562_CANMX|nr:Mitochondrial RNA splicing protein MRS3 [Candida maltosa Xu316]